MEEGEPYFHLDCHLDQNLGLLCFFKSSISYPSSIFFFIIMSGVLVLVLSRDGALGMDCE